jgi:excisionase family DNA binding protein
MSGDTSPERILVRKHEAGSVLGLSERKLDELVNRGEIPTIRIGRSVRFALSDLLAFVERQRHTGPAPRRGEAR